MVEKSFTIFYKYNKGCSDLGPLSRFCCLAYILLRFIRLSLASTLLLYNYSEKISNLHKQFRTYIYMFYATNVLVTISSTMVNRHFPMQLPGNNSLTMWCLSFFYSNLRFYITLYFVTLCCSGVQFVSILNYGLILHALVKYPSCTANSSQ